MKERLEKREKETTMGLKEGEGVARELLARERNGGLKTIKRKGEDEEDRGEERESVRGLRWQVSTGPFKNYSKIEICPLQNSKVLKIAPNLKFLFYFGPWKFTL